MTVIGEYTGAILATMKRDAMIFASYRLRFVSQLLTMLFSLTLFHYIARLVRPAAVGGAGHYYAFVVIGLIITTVLTSALQTAEIVRIELLQGNFERVLVSPLGPVGGIMAVAAFPIAYSMAFAAVVLGLAVGVYGVPIHLAGIAPAIAVSALGTMAFAAIGLLFVAGLLAYKSSMGHTWVIAGLSLLGGAYFPVKLFPGIVQWLSEVQPFTPSLDLLRHLLVGTPTLQPAWIELLKLGAFTAALIPISSAVLWFAIHVSRRRGTIMEY